MLHVPHGTLLNYLRGCQSPGEMGDIFGYEVYKAAKFLVTVFWVMAPFILICRNQHFERHLIVSAFSRLTATLSSANSVNHVQGYTPE
jgi:hypothetical protein